MTTAPKRRDDDKLVIFTFGPVDPEDHTISMYVNKADTHMRIAKVDYELQSCDNTVYKPPKGRIPFFLYEDTLIGDSTLGIRHFIDRGVVPDLDEGLTEEQKATSLAYQCLIEDNLYPAWSWERWVQDEGWQKLSATIFAHLPIVVSTIVPYLLRRRVVARYGEMDIGRHSPEEIMGIMRTDVKALSVLLGDKEYMLGLDRPTTIDCSLFGLLASNIGRLRDTATQEEVNKYPNLVRYRNHMLSTFFPERKQGFFDTMAQTPLKKRQSNAPKAKAQTKKQAELKRGHRSLTFADKVIAPKKANAVRQAQIKKKLTGQINKNIERQMATKAGAVGKLTIMKSLAEEASASKDRKKVDK
ncbi:hypothetical protein BZG36_01537 [Bifiguratus adelaidae]|uniref:GST C-terminal domain-containing protein n=1 Tax=Bifiguratus adelaidae TaxID=1938954 RepID=A0A261Y461_9FUNG|nr:hypothetical protein BZG36_01537 [Bifiguratus adelaidae]